MTREYFQPEDFYMQTVSWRMWSDGNPNIESLPYEEGCSVARTRLKKMMDTDKSKYDQFVQAHNSWVPREKKQQAEVSEKQPYSTTPSGKRVWGDDFGASALSDAGGFLETVMAEALNDSNTYVGDIHSLTDGVQSGFCKQGPSPSQGLAKIGDQVPLYCKFRYTVSPQQGGSQSTGDFVANLRGPNNETLNVSGVCKTSVLCYSSITSLAFLKEGPCLVKLEHNGTSNWKKQRFDQYNSMAGKETTSAQYQV